ncbi:MAG TPA: hypothetical protein VJ697_01935 [Nitrososphaeraceae archaeon]|jgi:hypothetical protein|nr:hypothetical protein [Nitrososphaeraceae archaeon]
MEKGKKEKKSSIPRIYDDETIEKMKKYYNIDDHTDLLKFIRSHGLHEERHYDNNEEIVKM